MKKLSLKIKSILIIMITVFTISGIAIAISYTVYSNTMNDHYKNLAMNTAKAAASQMDGDKIASYVVQVEALDRNAKEYDKSVQAIKDESYFEMLNTLYKIKNSMNALYLYVEKVSRAGAVYIIDADQGGSGCELGVTYPIAKVNEQYMDSLEKGIPAFISNSKDFGWLCSAGAPIFDSSGKVVALAFTDISMDKIVADRHNFLFFICTIILITAVIATTLILLLINKFVVAPINLLSFATGKFISERSGKDTMSGCPSAIARLNIHTGDEIENLSEAIKTMERDINQYIKNLTAVTAEKERISAELNVATQIQASMLPCIFPAFPEREEFDIYATMQPAKEVGGDFYDFFLVDNNHLAVVMADVSGKGVPAALFMVIAKTLIKNQTQTGNSPEEVFTAVNAQLCENNEAGMFVTAWMGVLEISTGRFTYVNAGHNPPLVKKGNGCYEYLKSRAGFVLAGMEGIRYRQFEMQLKPGDELYLYTDGVTEATNAKNELYGDYRLHEVLNRNMGTAPSLLLPIIKKDIDNFVMEAPQFDDITMLALKIRGRCHE